MLDKLREELKQAQAKLAQRDRLGVMLNDAEVQLGEIAAHERAPLISASTAIWVSSTWKAFAVLRTGSSTDCW